MPKILLIVLSYILIIFNTNLLSIEKNNQLKIGLLAPFTGEFKELGNSLLLSVQLAIQEIGDKNIIIIPRDSGVNNKKLLNKSVKDIANEGAKVIIGPINSESFEEIYKYKDLVFISPSNLEPIISNNIISIGISLESQIVALEKFIKLQKKKKTIILYPKNQYTEFLDKKINSIKPNNYKIFKYNSDPKILTGDIQKLTNYEQRKRNLELRKKFLEKKDDLNSERELKKLEQVYTLGKVNFDSVIVIDFGNNLKSVLTSLAFSDVNEKDVLFTTVNQWFDKSIFFENTLKTLYYPSVNYKNFTEYNKNYIKEYKTKPSEITILAYDSVGLIYYVWKKNKNINSIKDFLIKDKIRGKIGTFNFKDGRVFQELNIYKAEDNKFTKF
jgi:ABC-type branched-subunit amino acid transport system substrate-binding protein